MMFHLIKVLIEYYRPVCGGKNKVQAVWLWETFRLMLNLIYADLWKGKDLKARRSCRFCSTKTEKKFVNFFFGYMPKSESNFWILVFFFFSTTTSLSTANYWLKVCNMMHETVFTRLTVWKTVTKYVSKTLFGALIRGREKVVLSAEKSHSSDLTEAVVNVGLESNCWKAKVLAARRCCSFFSTKTEVNFLVTS